MQTFDGIIRLANIYLEMCASGSILFSKWTSFFYCQPDRKVNAIVDFGLAERNLQGTSEGSVNVRMQIVEVCVFMEECLQEWLHHISVVRKSHYSLNYFTTQQLVYLRQELAPLSRGGGHKAAEIADGVYPLLHFVQPNCTLRQLRQATTSAFRDLAETEHSTHKATEETRAEEAEREAARPGDDASSNLALERSFVTAMLESGFSEKLAMKAMTALGPDKVDEGGYQTC